MVPALLSCNPVLKEKAWWKPMTNMEWIEGVQGCPNPIGEEAWSKSFFWLQDQNCVDYLNGFTMTNNSTGEITYGSSYFDCFNSTVVCVTSVSKLTEARDTCGQNTCGSR